MACDVYMGQDVERQRLNVRMDDGEQLFTQLKLASYLDAVDAAFGAWMNDLKLLYVLGSVAGPHPYPTIVHEFQKVISEESQPSDFKKDD